jgi:tripartite ATP-independent transporter DctP family solute receptor
MMFKKFRCLALALILVVVSCTTFAANKSVKIVFGHVWPADHFFVKSDQYFKKLVEKNSKGQISVDYFPASQLGSGTEIIQAVRTNAQQMALTTPGGLTQIWQKLATFDLPYLFRDEKHQLKVAEKMTSLIDQDELAAKTGVRILGVRILSPRQLTTKFPVKKLEDIKGLKIRVPQAPLSLALWRALGAIPIVIPMTDTYTGLATGTIDAQENPYDSIWGWKVYEQVKYCALTSHVREIVWMIVNNDFWNSLTKMQQKLINDAAVKSCAIAIKAAQDKEGEYYKILVKEGMKFTKPDLTAFRKRAKTIWDQFGDKELIKKIGAVK